MKTVGDNARANIAVARQSVATAACLGILKLTGAVLTGSLTLVGSLVDTVMDLFASTMNLFAVRLAARPADEDHAYGHGKAEGLAGLAQGVVIAFAGLFLVVEGGRRLSAGWAIRQADLGIGVMVISTVVSYWIARRLRVTAARTGSVALAADSLHYATDVWTNLGALLALVAIRLTGADWIDGTVAAVVGAVVVVGAVRVLRRSADELMDRALPEEAVRTLLGAILAALPDVRGIHDVRTRRAGPTIFIELHLQIDRTASFVEAHRLTERVARIVADVHPGAQAFVHADPDPLLPSDVD